MISLLAETIENSGSIVATEKSGSAGICSAALAAGTPASSAAVIGIAAKKSFFMIAPNVGYGPTLGLVDEVAIKMRLNGNVIYYKKWGNVSGMHKLKPAEVRRT